MCCGRVCDDVLCDRTVRCVLWRESAKRGAPGATERRGCTPCLPPPSPPHHHSHATRRCLQVPFFNGNVISVSRGIVVCLDLRAAQLASTGVLKQSVGLQR